MNIAKFFRKTYFEELLQTAASKGSIENNYSVLLQSRVKVTNQEKLVQDLHKEAGIHSCSIEWLL